MWQVCITNHVAIKKWKETLKEFGRGWWHFDYASFNLMGQFGNRDRRLLKAHVSLAPRSCALRFSPRLVSQRNRLVSLPRARLLVLTKGNGKHAVSFKCVMLRCAGGDV